MISQTVSVISVSVSGVAVTVVSTIVVGGSLGVGITTLASGTGNGNVKGIHTGCTFDSSGDAMDAIVSSIEAIGSKTVSGVAGVASKSGVSSTGISSTGISGMA